MGCNDLYLPFPVIYYIKSETTGGFLFVDEQIFMLPD